MLIISSEIILLIKYLCTFTPNLYRKVLAAIILLGIMQNSYLVLGIIATSYLHREQMECIRIRVTPILFNLVLEIVKVKGRL